MCRTGQQMGGESPVDFVQVHRNFWPVWNFLPRGSFTFPLAGLLFCAVGRRRLDLKTSMDLLEPSFWFHHSCFFAALTKDRTQTCWMFLKSQVPLTGLFVAGLLKCYPSHGWLCSGCMRMLTCAIAAVSSGEKLGPLCMFCVLGGTLVET